MPLRVDITFFFPRPKGHYRTGKNAGQLRDDAPDHHTSKPDRDNSDKAVLDQMTVMRFWRDDAQVCDGRIIKQYDDGRGPGALIKISEA
jgi:Holliday junction resolvase RusA-like endonuclease